MKYDSELRAAVHTVYERRLNVVSISPTWLAGEALKHIGFSKEMHALGYQGCHLYLRQVAREFCRNKFDPDAVVENDLFPEILQERYPLKLVSTDAEPQYVLLDRMEKGDIEFNVERLRREAKAKLRHADALEAWMFRKFSPAAA